MKNFMINKIRKKTLINYESTKLKHKKLIKNIYVGRVCGCDGRRR